MVADIDAQFDPNEFVFIGIPFTIAWSEGVKDSGMRPRKVLRARLTGKDQLAGWAVPAFTDADLADTFLAENSSANELTLFRAPPMEAFDELLVLLQQEGVTHATIDPRPDRGQGLPIQAVSDGVRRGPI
jgi:hypothetical protein